MASDGKDPGAIWQGPSKPNWGQSLQQAQDEDPDELAVSSQQFADQSANPPLTNEEEEPPGVVPPATSAVERLKYYLQLISPVLIPLLFGGLTSLFVVPLIAEGRASATVDNLWLIIAIIAVVVVAQIVALFYAGANNSLWVMAAVGGFFLFVLVGSFAIFGPMVGIIMLIVLVALSGILLRFYFHPVPEGMVDITYAFGKYSRTLFAGPNVLFPWEKVAHSLKVSEVQWICPLQRVQLSRTEDVLLRATISYQLSPEDASLAVTQVDRWEESLRELFMTCVQTVATAFAPEDFISWPEGLHTPPSVNENVDSIARRDRINSYLYRQMSDKAALCGVMVHWVGVRDIMLAPHDALIDMEALFTPPEAPQPTPQMPKTPVMNNQFPDRPPEKTPNIIQKPSNVPKASENALVVENGSKSVSPKILSEAILKKAYKEVQDGKVTDPQTIREIAANFQAVAEDPQASQKVNFDAGRAAQNLYEQARKYEGLSKPLR